MKLKLAILDMYEGTPNQGMRCIQDILKQFDEVIDYQVFDVRSKRQIPDMSFDIYISTGGPGDPRVGDGVWEKLYYAWVQKVWDFNLHNEDQKKHVFFICHSFQMACMHFGIGTVSERKSMSFGTFPVYQTEESHSEPLFEGLDNPFYIADFRRFQVVQPNEKQLDALDIEIVALEKPRPHIPLERAIMAVRFSNEVFGTQFHPEADGDGMLVWFQQEDKKQQVITEHGIEKYNQMIEDLSDPNKIERTQNTILPRFLHYAVTEIMENALLV
jgi:homoserine O-succinyltransferase/O-acetyltransferase